MMKLGLTLALMICGFLSYQNYTLREKVQELETKLDTRVEPVKAEPTPSASQDKNPCQANPKLAYLEKLVEYRKRLLDKQTQLAELKKKLETLKAKSPKIADPVEFDRRIHEKKEQLTELREQIRLARQNPNPQRNSPEYEGIKGKLQEIEKQIHDLKASQKAIDQGADSNNSAKKTEIKVKLAELHDQLREAQTKQKSFMNQSEESTGSLPESTLKRKATALSKEIHKMEALKESPANPQASSTPNSEPLEKEISTLVEEIHALEKLIAELEALSADPKKGAAR